MTAPGSEERSNAATAGDSAPSDEFVRELASYDERLREGLYGQRADAKVQALSATTPVDDPRECLRLLERAWPRKEAAVLPAPLPAQIGRFEIVRLLGHGGFGMVYLARDATLGRPLALKVPRPHALDQRSIRDRFLREARATAKLSHPHIVPIYEVGADGATCYIASMYCPGVNLAEWLAAQSGSVSCRLAATLVACLADAIDYSHSQGVLHRDLKPGNVLCVAPQPNAAADGQRPPSELPFVPYITDFGLAKLIESSLEETGTSVILGTPLYMAPEQAEGLTGEIGPATDIYALGALLYELLTKRPPFSANSFVELLDQLRGWQPTCPSVVRADIPRDLETICLKCLSKEPSNRYPTAAALARDLHRYLRNEPIEARREGPWASVRRWSVRPQRMHDAGLFTMALNLTIIVWMVTNVVHIVGGGIVSPEFFEAEKHGLYVDHAVIMFGLHVPQVLLGWLMLKGRIWAYRAGLAYSILLALYLTLVLTGLFKPPFRGFYADPILRTTIFHLLWALFILQGLMQFVGLMVRRAKLMAARSPR